MRPALPILILTTAYFAVAFTSYSQVSAEDQPNVTVDGKPCRVIRHQSADAADGSGTGLSSSVTVGGGTGTATTTVGGGTTGSVASSSTTTTTATAGSGGDAGSSTSSVTSSDGKTTTVITSDGTCIITTRP
jgi:hypothetical protein